METGGACASRRLDDGLDLPLTADYESLFTAVPIDRLGLSAAVVEDTSSSRLSGDRASKGRVSDRLSPD